MKKLMKSTYALRSKRRNIKPMTNNTPIASVVPSTDDRLITDYRPNSVIDIAILFLLSIAAIALIVHIRTIWHKLYDND